jgi:peptidoglycan/LPS O-acetylase OafA/YrhL
MNINGLVRQNSPPQRGTIVPEPDASAAHLPGLAPGTGRARRRGRAMASVGTVLDAQNGYGAGFDFLRIFLALSIVAWHTATLTGHRDLARSTSFWFAEYFLVPCFFMLSGFLVAGSGMRLSLREFCLNRLIRICPALFVDVCFSALVIGPIVTVLPLSIYFLGRTFFTYGLNVVGWPHYLLPGVFERRIQTP